MPNSSPQGGPHRTDTAIASRRRSQRLLSVSGVAAAIDGFSRRLLRVLTFPIPPFVPAKAVTRVFPAKTGFPLARE
jgi:hypothetical protein